MCIRDRMMAVDGTVETSIILENKEPRPNSPGMNFNNISKECLLQFNENNYVMKTIKITILLVAHVAVVTAVAETEPQLNEIREKLNRNDFSFYYV